MQNKLPKRKPTRLKYIDNNPKKWHKDEYY